MEVPSPFGGTIAALRAEPGQQVKVGDIVLTYTGVVLPDAKPAAAVAAEPPARAARAEPPATAKRNGPTAPPARSDLLVKAAPSVRYLAQKLGIDLGRVRGTGPEGRILLEDISATLATRVPAARERPETAEPSPDYGTPGTRIKLQGLRRKIAEHMVESKRTIPHYSYVDECDVSRLVELRDSLREPCARQDVKLTYLAFFVKAAARALKEVPIVNSSLDEAAGEIVLHDAYHIGVAVATPGGLIVPVVRDADRKDLLEIAREIERLSTDTRAGRARRDDLRGSTFTVTSIGNIGGLFSTPVINHPEVGILGVGKITRRPVYDDAGQVRPADLIYLSFSFDHRVVDGAVGAAFGNAVARQLRHPATLLLPEPPAG
jgi:2-oxoisovalerate dehydrogenase E2 component (dihydrolipoyl transacylase)